MKNNVYIRSNKSIFSISIMRFLCLLPLIIYGYYKNALYLYIHKYENYMCLLKPLIILGGSILIASLINIFYEYVIKKNYESLLTVIFSSFHVEYAVLLSCLMPVSINFIIYFSVLFILLFISKFLNNRINIIAVIFITIYGLSFYFDKFDFLNSYELSKVFSLDFMDYLIGKGPGGLFTTHIIFLVLALFILYLTNNNKTNIALSSIIIFFIVAGIYSLFAHQNFSEILFKNNYLFIFSFVATDSVTSSYTIKGMIVFGVLVGLITFGFYFVNPIIAPMIAIIIVSLFNNLIDRKCNDFKNPKE